MEHVQNAQFVKFLLAAAELKMHELANEIIEKKNGKVIDFYSYKNQKEIYQNQKEINPSGCELYGRNEKCHNMKDIELNCYFCFCPNYDRTVKEGACKINSPNAKYIDNHEGKILDCSDCDFPHKRENAIKLLDNLFK